MSNEEELINKALNAFLEGEGKVAEALYQKAAEMGCGHAAHNFRVLYITGAPGVQPDNVKSHYWLNLAFELGFEEAIASDPVWFKPKA